MTKQCVPFYTHTVAFQERRRHLLNCYPLPKEEHCQLWINNKIIILRNKHYSFKKCKVYNSGPANGFERVFGWSQAMKSVDVIHMVLNIIKSHQIIIYLSAHTATEGIHTIFMRYVIASIVKHICTMYAIFKFLCNSFAEVGPERQFPAIQCQYQGDMDNI